MEKANLGEIRIVNEAQREAVMEARFGALYPLIKMVDILRKGTCKEKIKGVRKRKRGMCMGIKSHEYVG